MDYDSGEYGQNCIYEERYEKLHELHPERVILGTETRHTMMVGTMRFAKTHPYLIGDFVWTLQDHLGEANCCNLHYDESEKAYKDYPWLINYGGVIDINGTILPAIHRYEFAWGEYSGRPKHGLYLASQPPIHEGKAPLVESYRWTDTVEGWTYEGFEGKKTFVDAYTDADTVAVFINGNHAGTAKVNDYFDAVGRGQQFILYGKFLNKQIKNAVKYQYVFNTSETENCTYNSVNVGTTRIGECIEVSATNYSGKDIQGVGIRTVFLKKGKPVAFDTVNIADTGYVFHGGSTNSQVIGYNAGTFDDYIMTYTSAGNEVVLDF